MKHKSLFQSVRGIVLAAGAVRPGPRSAAGAASRGSGKADSGVSAELSLQPGESSWASRHVPIIAGLALTIAWFTAMVLLIGDRWTDIRELELNALGDFLGGAIAPLAFLWLVVGIMQQQQELLQNTKALLLQAKELREQVEATRALATSAADQLDVDRTRLQHEQVRDQPVLVAGGSRWTHNTAALNLVNHGGGARGVSVSGPCVTGPADKSWLGSGESLDIRWQGDVAVEFDAEVRYSDASGQRWEVSIRMDKSREPLIQGPRRVNEATSSAFGR